MKILFCNITYLNKYIGITDDDMPNKGGAWVTKNKDAHEQWNFLNYDGYCYGFVQNKGESFYIERIDKTAADQDLVDGVTVVWCALNDKGETVIVGWYENATVYRYYQSSICTPIYGLDRYYFTRARAEDCCLLPEENRTFSIGRASVEGKGKGFGQNNYWFAESAYARKELIPAVEAFIEENRGKGINRTDKDFSEPENVKECLTDEEIKLADELYNDNSFFEFLPLGYRLYNEVKNADRAYYLGTALAALHQYSAAITWFNRVIETEGESWGVKSFLPYLYQQCERYDDAAESAESLLRFDEAKEENVRFEIYGIIADSLFFSGRTREAIVWLDKILEESANANLNDHTLKTKEEWLKYL